MIRVCHLTSVHDENDTRIFLKECVSLSRNGYEVFFVVAGAQSHVVDWVNIVGVKKIGNRLMRIVRAWRPVYEAAVAIDAQIYHIHDPELLKAAVRLRLRGKTVVYDSHEDLPRQILAKPWIPSGLRPLLSRVVERVENARARKMSAIVTATPHIKERFEQLLPSDRVCAVGNFPILDEIKPRDNWDSRPVAACYIGGIFRERGIEEMVCAAGNANIPLLLAGTFAPPSLLGEMQRLDGWKNVDYRGFLDRRQVDELLADSMMGLLLLHPLPSYKDSLPIKLFEYMAAGIPVVCSDFPLWRGIVEDCHCGLCVDPLDAKAVASAVRQLASDRELAHLMGQRGRAAVENKYSWKSQEKILLDLYATLL
ncbi:MAG: glycosyltransferase family 4 protein [Bacteroidales bacterium]|nr:glycosyltransferase family 4 protein [Bacteroidales bacterium]